MLRGMSGCKGYDEGRGWKTLHEEVCNLQLYQTSMCLVHDPGTVKKEGWQRLSCVHSSIGKSERKRTHTVLRWILRERVWM
jgi:hypothetical protein